MNLWRELTLLDKLNIENYPHIKEKMRPYYDLQNNKTMQNRKENKDRTGNSFQIIEKCIESC